MMFFVSFLKKYLVDVFGYTIMHVEIGQALTIDFSVQ